MKEDRKAVLKSVYLTFFMIGFLFAFFCLTGHKLAEAGNILWTVGYTLGVMGGSAAFGALLSFFACYGMPRIVSVTAHKWSAVGEKVSKCRLAQKVSGSRVRKVFLCSFLLIMMCWLPCYLAYYPAICSYDSPVQTEQIERELFIDHHPIAHTLLIKGAMLLGENVLGSINRGIGVFALAQQIFLAAVFALGVAFLWQKRCRRVWMLLLQLFCMLYPFHLYMSVTMTKDTIFSGFFLLQLLALSRLLDSEAVQKKSKLFLFLYFLGTVGMILFRNNGKYAYLVLLVFLAMAMMLGKANRRMWRSIFLWSAAAFLTGNLLLTALFHITDAEQGDRREMLSIPIQQLARTYLYHGGAGVLPEDDNTMDDVDKALINDFLLNESYQWYDPAISDPVKRHTNTYIVRYRTADFCRTYFRLLSQYPGDFVNAVLAVDAGYLYPWDVSHANVNVTDAFGNMGYIQTRWDEDTLNDRGIFKETKWEELFRQMEQWADQNAYLQLPVLKYLFVPGVWLYFYLLLFGRLLMKGRLYQCMPFTLVLGYYLTLLLGPTVQLRYIYPIMITFPFLALMCMGRSTARNEVL